MTALLLAAIALADPVEGRVLERGTGVPLAGAWVEAAVGEEVLATRTGDDGRFVLDLPEGAWEVHARAEDHAADALEVSVPRDRPLRFFLSPRPPLVVVVEAFQETPHVATHALDAEMALETPGTYEDAVRLVQTLPGVAVQREYGPQAGDLQVRGAGATDNRYLLDGIELPWLYHFNQYASVFPTRWIDRLELLPSTFGAAHGDTVGAIVDARSRVERPAAVHGGVDLNLVMAGAEVEVPVGEAWWVGASGRRSYQDLGGRSTERFSVWPTFWDHAVRAGHSGDHADTWLFAWGAGDRYTRRAAADALGDPDLSLQRAFSVFGAGHRWGVDRRRRLVTALVHDRLQAQLGEGRQDLRHHTWTTRLDDQRSFGRDLTLTWGLESRLEHLGLLVAGASGLGVLVAEEAPALGRGVDVDADTLRWRGAAYTQALWTVGDVGLMPGVRLTTDTGARARLAPRLAGRWRLGPQTALLGSLGRYHQAPPTELLLREPSLPTARAWQATVALEQTVAERLEVRVDVYGKALRDTLVLPPGAPPEVAAQGRAFGAELSTRYRIRDVVFVHGFVALSRSLVGAPGGWRPADADQPLSAGAVASWDLGERWTLGLRYQLGSGRPWTPVTGRLYDATLDRWLPVPGETNSARMPLYQKLDLHVGHTWTFDRWRLTASAEVWWVPPASAALYPVWSHDYAEQGWVVGPVLLPVASLRARF